MSRESAAASSMGISMSPLRGFGAWSALVLRAYARSYVLPSLRDFQTARTFGPKALLFA